ncbi:hypothetical protein NKH48_35080 [Mesorhizobium sp. M1233]|uniref:hypothetical protein n=1 Tax=Mesorhizobium sp. M1233 TaxID=2957072 RepID=UPI003338280D
MLTIGIEGLANSKPGPSREGLAAAVLVASLVIVLLRANFAWRRSRDAQGSGWILWSYIVFSTLFAILQAGTVLVVKFDGEDSHSGLNLLGLALVGLWAVILAGKPAGGGSADMASSLSFDDFDPPGPLRGTAALHSESAAGATAQAAAYPCAPHLCRRTNLHLNLHLRRTAGRGPAASASAALCDRLAASRP